MKGEEKINNYNRWKEYKIRGGGDNLEINFDSKSSGWWDNSKKSKEILWEEESK